ncbi:MAG: Hint domain-containing protein [Alphaproteobacteria bacterium]|nr:Hint domain-containing protein [Alphaproteobacteria bacterium]
MTKTISNTITIGYYLTGEPLVVTSLGAITPATPAAGVYAPGAATISNAGIILAGGPQAAIYIHGGASVTNSGTISGASFGIYAADVGAPGLIVNTGTIAATSGLGSGIGLARGGTVQNGGTITGAGFYGAILFDGGSVNNDAGGLIAGNKSGVGFRLGAGTVTNFGTITALPNAPTSPPLLPGAVALAAGGTVTNGTLGSTAALITGWESGVYIKNLEGTVTNFGTITGAEAGVRFSGTGGSVFNQGTISGITASVDFGATGNGFLFLDFGWVLAGPVVNFRVDDLIAFHHESLDPVSYSDGVLTLDGSRTVSIAIAGSHVLSDFSVNWVVDDYPLFTTLLTVACFAEGTRLLTDRGERPVETLRAGDRVAALLGGGLARIRWVGQRRIVVRRHPDPERVRPVRIAPGALAPGVPHRALLVSPDHALHLDGALIPAHLLVNGATITQIDVDTVTYWHVELDRHDVVLAEGAAAETYLDTGNRGAFAGEAAAMLHPDFAAASFAAWHERACAPLLLGGDRLAAVHEMLLRRATALGWSRCDDAALAVFAGEEVLTLHRQPDGVAVDLPAGCAFVRLRSRSFRPSWTGGADHRRLGVPITDIALDGRKVPLAALRCADGWRDAEPGLRWTDGDATLATPGATRLTFTMATIGAHYWRRGTSDVAAKVDRAPRAGG